MNRVLSYLRRPRLLLVGLFGVAMCLAWFGVWVRMLPIRPRAVIRTSQGFQPRFFSDDGRLLLGTTPIRENAQPKGEVRQLDLLSGEEVLLGKIPDDWRLGGELPGRQFVNVLDLPRLHSELQLLEKSNYVDLSTKVTDRLAVRFQSMTPPAAQTGVQLWDTSGDRKLLDRPGDSTFALSPCGNRLATAPYAGSQLIHLWNARDGSHVANIDLGFLVRGPNMSFSPDGGQLAILGPASLHIWNLDPLHCVAELDDLNQALLTSSWDFAVGQCDWRRNITFSLRLVEVGTGNEVARISPFPSLDDFSTFYAAGPVLVPRSDWLAVVYRCQWKQADAVGSWWRSLMGWERASAHGVATTVRFYRPGTWQMSSSIVQAGQGYPVFSLDGTSMALTTPEEQTVSVYDLPPRRPVELYLFLSALPALLFTGLLWWRVR